MSSTLHQMTVNYVAEQDRVLLRVSTTDNTEVQLWLTRRFTKILWDVLVQTIDSLGHQNRPNDMKDERSVAATRAVEHQEALKKVLTDTPSDSNEPPTAMSTNPLLIVEINSRLDKNGTAHLNLKNNDGKDILLTLNTELLHGFLHQISSVANTADWGLELMLSQRDASVTIPTGKQQLH